MGFDIKGVEQTTTQIQEAARATTQKVEPVFGQADAFKYNPEYNQMADFLGLDGEERHNIEWANKINFIREFTKESDETNARVKIKEMMRSLGINTKGKELIKTLYQYSRLAQEREKIDKEISLITNLPTENVNKS